ncbi:helix-turn-helix domain-containing protein [Pseudoalteromonas tunicata]|uniref:helix-turn-helix domain-containing protein n=1 Tax=Pseudoalteromonas tunicata TaxID=314281 RepID=UPI00274006E7|nr:AraC family transcriptional regulator [Pseudoalteromonas tunicata]MDP5214657.1 helix-turn-helix domain-containing protein [Pseudoalteromonas tunicata]
MRYFEQQQKLFSSQQFAAQLIDIAMSRGVHVDKLLKGTQLFYQDIIKRDALISINQLDQLIHNSLKYIPGDDVSFLYGRHVNLAPHGLLPQALNHCQNFASQLRLSQCFQFQLCPMLFFQPRDQQDQRHLIINFALGQPKQQGLRFWCEFLASSLIANFKRQLGYTPAITIKFPYPEPDYLEQYQTHLAVLCEFDFPFFMISVPKSLLTMPFINTSLTQKRFALAQLGKLKSARLVGLIQYIVQLLEHQSQLGLEEVAEQLCISPATLKRKLKQHGCQFSELKDQVRQQKAIFAMLEQGYSNEKVAFALQFSDLTNFRRTFKRWTGMTPSQLRNQFGC